ncbi:heavy metal translocating P-type ATPase [Emcibacter nanhaiensis]|uniref:Cadmium-translocating P-type ATPase n=1 Tax=Emcibacter nanhaiensis TaxID=1505037 RepID=A0A501PN63_9PROT|nr:heavy metal translocating P-type ATPase [Emcibacter nanhaiensis]TPD61879.1 cadmium-translocating P-type ATPase [Emcibacter nanhaiensis]
MAEPLKSPEVEHFVVEGLHCPSCIREIEGTLQKNPAIRNARVNLTTQRLAVQWANDDQPGSDEALSKSEQVIDTLKDIGFRAFRFKDDPSLMANDKESRQLLISMAVAGFVAANVMLLSVSVWSGNVSDMAESTRLLMHWLSALLVLPAAAYAGLPFYRSAWGAVKAGTLNMDVPISLAVILACGMSLLETMQGAVHTYYDAAVMLLFFLLIGRYLDRKMRNHARGMAQNLMSYRPHTATLLLDNGETELSPLEMLRPGQTVRVMPGDRIPVDGEILRGVSEVDTSLVTGETLPVKAEEGAEVFAGTMNLNGVLDVKITALSGKTLLDEIITLMETAEQGRAKYVRLADKAAKIYAPAVHLLALFTFLGWMLFSSVGWEQSLITAISVLIITCPCALGLAVPVVQVVASNLLFKSGILVKAADGLERLAEVDTVIFDKTGTLTLGQPELANADEIEPARLELAASLAKSSTHPLCRALIVACHERDIPTIATESALHEEAGMGLKAVIDGREVRLGNRSWCSVPDTAVENNRFSELWLAVEGEAPVFLAFRDRLRRDASEVCNWLKKDGLELILLSGDREDVVREVAAELGIDNWRAGFKPQEKIAVLEELKANGKKPLMVGDGLNDAPALAAAHVSISPSSAADVSQNAADFIFQSQRLETVVRALQVSRKSRTLVFVNFAFAAAYNVVAVPFAAAGMLTPLIAALAMSGSSIVVTLNALRLNLARLYSSKGNA